MFTGLVADTGHGRGRRARRPRGEAARAHPLAPELAGGDSIAVNGVCLTARDPDGGAFAADLMAETLERSSLGPLAAGDEVNLELPLRAGDRLGGHVVQGHVDGMGTVERVEEDGLLARRAHGRAARSCCATWSTRARSRWTACPLP